MSVVRGRGISIVAISLSVLIAGCTGGSQGPGGTAKGGPTAGPAGEECKSIPTFNLLASPQPSFPTDSTLQSEFPEKVGDEPVDNVQSMQMLAFMCYLAGQSAVDELRQAASALGWNISTMSYGSFDATADGDTLTVNAVRVPDQDVGKLISNFALFGSFFGISVAGTDLSSSTVAGKNVQATQADSDGTRSYFYVHGDTLFVIEDATEAQATAILQALP